MGKNLKYYPMIVGNKYILTPLEQKIVELTAQARQHNKEITGVNGKGTAAKDDNHLHRNVIGFGGEFIFCKNYNLYPDFSIKNTSKIQGTDDYDATLNGITIDVKVTDKNLPLMTPHYSKSKVGGFAFFHCNYPEYTFKGFATNEQLFNEDNLRNVKVKSYVLELKNLLSEIEFIFLNKLNKQRNEF